MCENTQSAWLLSTNTCSKPMKPSSSVLFVTIRLTAKKGMLVLLLLLLAPLILLALVQVRASLPSNMGTISPTAHIGWVSCRYVRASTGPLQREVTRWGNCVSNAEIASLTRVVNQVYDGDKRAEVDIVRNNQAIDRVPRACFIFGPSCHSQRARVPTFRIHLKGLSKKGLLHSV
jgi:hypothetical protein